MTGVAPVVFFGIEMDADGKTARFVGSYLDAKGADGQPIAWAYDATIEHMSHHWPSRCAMTNCPTRIRANWEKGKQYHVTATLRRARTHTAVATAFVHVPPIFDTCALCEYDERKKKEKAEKPKPNPTSASRSALPAATPPSPPNTHSPPTPSNPSASNACAAAN